MTLTQASTTYVTKEGERWDQIAYNCYGDARLFPVLLRANTTLAATPKLPAGVELRVPIIDVTETESAPTPPWATQDGFPDDSASKLWIWNYVRGPRGLRGFPGAPRRIAVENLDAATTQDLLRIVGDGGVTVALETDVASQTTILRIGLGELELPDVPAIEAAIAALSAAIQAEATTRAQADTGLVNAIQAEAEARAQADTVLQQNIAAEAQARATAIATLANRVSQLEVVAGATGTRLDALDNLVDSLQQQDAALATQIQAIIDGYQPALPPGLPSQVLTINADEELEWVTLAPGGGWVPLGTYNAATNTPALQPASAFASGSYYRISVAGQVDVNGTGTAIDLQPLDFLVSNGAIWEKIDNTDALASINGKAATGALVLDDADIDHTPADSDNTNGFFSGLLATGRLRLRAAFNRIVERINAKYTLPGGGTSSDYLTGLGAIAPLNTAVREINVGGTPAALSADVSSADTLVTIANKLLHVQQARQLRGFVEVPSPASGGTVTLDLALGSYFRIVLTGTGGWTLDYSNHNPAQYYTVEIVQPAGVLRSLIFAPGKWAAPAVPGTSTPALPVLTVAGAIDKLFLSFVSHINRMEASHVPNYSSN